MIDFYEKKVEVGDDNVVLIYKTDCENASKIENAIKFYEHLVNRNEFLKDELIKTETLYFNEKGKNKIFKEEFDKYKKYIEKRINQIEEEIK